MDSRAWPCPSCGEVRDFVQPSCAEGHGVECPEWACVDCGTAMLIGDVGTIAPTVRESVAA